MHADACRYVKLINPKQHTGINQADNALEAYQRWHLSHVHQSGPGGYHIGLGELLGVWYHRRLRDDDGACYCEPRGVKTQVGRVGG